MFLITCTGCKSFFTMKREWGETFSIKCPDCNKGAKFDPTDEYHKSDVMKAFDVSIVPDDAVIEVKFGARKSSSSDESQTLAFSQN